MYKQFISIHALLKNFGISNISGYNYCMYVKSSLYLVRIYFKTSIDAYCIINHVGMCITIYRTHPPYGYTQVQSYINLILNHALIGIPYKFKQLDTYVLLCVSMYLCMSLCGYVIIMVYINILGNRMIKITPSIIICHFGLVYDTSIGGVYVCTVICFYICP